MPAIRTIAPCLWFDHQAEEAATFYTAIFDDSRILQVTRYGKAGKEIHGREAGTVMTVEFELDGHRFTALNGGPMFTFNEAVSLQVICETQEQVDYYWERLGEGGDEHARQCGWLKDRYGVSWQVTPDIVQGLFGDPTSEGFDRAMEALLRMKKIDIAALQRAWEG